MIIKMKTLSKTHRENISKASKLNWAHKHMLDPPNGEANRGDVVKALKYIVCHNCDLETKDKCSRLVQERVRNGKLIQCMQKNITYIGVFERDQNIMSDKT
jgi:hypothetical protein